MDNLKKEDKVIDYKKVISRALKYWYLFVFTISISLTIAYLINRYTVKTYPVSMSLVIKSSREASPASELYRNAMGGMDRNHYNEIYILKSFPLINKVIKRTNFKYSFYKEGNFKTTLFYPGVPLEISIGNNSSHIPYNKPFHFEVANSNEFFLGEIEEDEKDVKNIRRHSFGDTVFMENFSFIFNKIPGRRYDHYVGEQLIFKILNENTLTNQYKGKLKVSWAAKGASILQLSVVGENTQREIDFLKALAEAYIEYDLEQKNEDANKTIDFINEQLKEITDSLNFIESQLENFKSNKAPVNLSMEAQRIYGKLENLEANKAEMHVLNSYYDYISKTLKQDNMEEQMVVPSALGIADPVLNSLIDELVKLQMEKEDLKSGNPYLPSLNKRVKELKTNIVENIKNLQESSRIREDDIDFQINKFENEIALLPKAEREFINIKRMYDLSEKLYLFLMEKKAEVGIKKASTVSDIAIVNPPFVSGGAIKPTPQKNYMMAIIIGLLIPIGFCFLLELLNNKIITKEDLAQITSIPFLGVVGHNANHSNKVVYDKPKAAISESFRSIRSNIHYFTADKEKKIFVVSSSLSGEGKTFCSINLSLAFSLSGKKTLLIGADLRKPKIFKDFNLHNEEGLSTYLANLSCLEQIIQKTEAENLDIISAGPVPPNPSELLMSNKMSDLLVHLQEFYDYIIIDTPPVTVVTDAQILMAHADHTIFITRQNYTPKEAIKSVQEMYEAGMVKNLSMVLNDIQTTSGYKYSYVYGSSYGAGYYDEEPKKSFWKKVFG